MHLIANMSYEGGHFTADQEAQQLIISNAIQFIHIGKLIHEKGIVDLSILPNYGNDLASDDDLIVGNKIALLVGDFLLSNAVNRINELRNSDVLFVVSRAIVDVSESSFLGACDKDGNALPFDPSMIPDKVDLSFTNSHNPVRVEGKSGTAEDEWILRQTLHRGFLVAKGCQASAILSGGSRNIQRNCFELGKHLFLAWQASDELKFFNDSRVHDVSLTSAPVLSHLSHEPSLYQEICDESNSAEGLNHEKLREKVINGPGMIGTRKLIEKLKGRAFDELSSFRASEQKDVVKDILSEL